MDHNPLIKLEITFDFLNNILKYNQQTLHNKTINSYWKALFKKDTI